MVRETGCDGVMIGRAALWDPWIFASAARALAEGRPAPPPSAAERRALLWEVFTETASRRGERMAVLQMRKFASLYLRGFAGARRLRERIQTMDTAADVASILEGVFADGAPLGEPAVSTVAE
jgi:tRNA-dihydrouridine synthase